MKAQHTPGPWKVNPVTGEIMGVREGCSMPIIAKMPVWWPGAEVGHASQRVQMDNARLIAAAPELLEALQAVEQTYAAWKSDDHNGWASLCEQMGKLFPDIQAAIASATGKEKV